ncbi:hypothetical protein GF314_16155, partial [bacterium]|nr:hypothetical protein [bacterium]
MTGTSSQSPWRLAALAVTVLALLLVAAALLRHSTGDLDLLLHDRTGSDILAGEGIPDTNTYSFTAPDHRWTNHEWLFQALVATAGDLTGSGAIGGRATGWAVLRLVLGLGLVAVLLMDAWRHRRTTPAALAAWVGLVSLGLLWTRLTMRPEILSAILLVVVLGRIETALRSGRDDRWPLAVVDPRRAAGQATWLTVLWYQCHGFAVLAPVMWLLAAALDRGAGPARERWRWASVGALLGLLAGAATPSGPAGLLYPLQVIGQFTGDGPDLQRTISELVPLLE